MLATAERAGAVAAMRPRHLWGALAEGAALAVSPLAAFFGLRLRLMSPADLNDPAMHTTFILDPRDIFLRYTAAFTPSDRLREGARAGFLVPARISYLLFGAVPGFVVFRYALALVAVVPAYLLLRRLYGRWAGAVGVIVILTCPVIITAWGTDFPDSAVVSYLIGGLACLAMPSKRRRVGWLLASAVLLTMAVWAFASAAPLVLATVAAYALVRLVRDREALVRDTAILVGTAVVVTGVLMIGSGLLIGQFDYIVPTVKSLIYLSHPSQEAVWHSSSSAWAPYDTYLLVPPAVLGVWLVAFGARVQRIPSPQLFVGVACAGQLAVYVLLQFVGKVQVLEMHYFSSMLWGSVILTLALALVELGRPLLAHRLLAWLLPVLLVAVTVAYEADPHVPAFAWLPFGAVCVAILAALSVIARGLGRESRSVPARVASAGSLALVAGCALVLTVAPEPAHPPIPGTVYDPPPAYATALGGDDTFSVDMYAVATKLPTFVGPAAYSGEQLVMWWPGDEVHALLEPIGIYHAFFDSIPGGFGALAPAGRQMIEQRRPAQVLLLGLSDQQFAASLDALTPFRPEMVRAGTLSSGSVALHVALVDLHLFLSSGGT